MDYSQQQQFNFLYEQHFINLRLQGKRPATIDGYSRAIRRISTYFDRSVLPDKDIINTSYNRVTFKYKDSQTQAYPVNRRIMALPNNEEISGL
ncbi:hypothetical protein [Moritella sp.]|uniref:hypothetical protein n=1 Tax=Moritella sp. TaxID=78556 RepID=UPI0025DD6B6C|nr:hypothetical protein [Moritella sp.]